MSDETPPVLVWELSGSAWQQVGQVHTYDTLTVDQRYNQPGSWSLSMPFNNQAALLTKTRVITVEVHGERFTGLIETPTPQSDDQGQPILEVGGSGALGLLSDTLCYPDPDSGPGAQLKARYQAHGAAEDVLHDLIVANVVTRRGTPVSVPSSSGRGGNVHVNLFFANLLAVVLKAVERSGLGVHMGLVNTTSATRAEMRLWFTEPTDKSLRVRLSHKVNTLRSWKQSDVVPTGTRAIVAGAIEGTAYRITDVDLTANSMTTDGSHGLRTGDLVTFHGAALPEPLEDGGYYYAIRNDADTFKVAKRQDKALARDPLGLTSLGGLKVNSVVFANDNLTVSKGDVPETGDRFRLIGSGDAPNPLSKNTTYYAIKVDRDTIKAATSEAHANAGTPIDLTNNGSGELRIFETNARNVNQVHRRIITAADTAAEAEWGRQREVFVDARSDDSDDDSVFEEKGFEALDDMAAQSSFELEAVDSAGMRYGEHYTLGDTVTIELLTGVSTTDRLGAVTFEVSDSGPSLKLIPGNPDAGKPEFKQAAILRGLNARLRNLEQEES